MNTSSILIGTVCLYLIMGMAGCATTPDAVREAIKNRQHECTEGDVIIIVQGDERAA